MHDAHNCSFCNSTHTNVVDYVENFKVGRKQLHVAGLKKVVCNDCHSESVPANLYDYNLQLFINAEAAAKELVSPASLKELREVWGLSQKEASIIFGAGTSSFGKWESHQSNMSTPAALLIKAASNIPEVVPFLSQLAHVELEQDTYGYKGLSCLVRRGAYEAMHIAPEAMNGNVFFLPNKNSRNSSQAPASHKPVVRNWINADVKRVREAA